MTHTDVKELQKFLNNNGYLVSASGSGSNGNETNYFGLKTKLALIKFQLSKNIKPSIGWFYPITRGIVNGMLK
jgi:peptidoglycan hydrolase-like protein with peptidoglycan-binding domain